MDNLGIREFIVKNNEGPFINSSVDKKQLKKVIIWFLQTYGENHTITFLEKLKEFGFFQSTQAGISLGLDDLQIPKNKKNILKKTNILLKKTEFDNFFGNITSIEKSQRTIDLWNNTSILLRDTVIKNFRLKKNSLNSLSMMAFSGARGNISQVQQLVGMRGLMADPQGSIVEIPIQNNFREGITLPEYLISCYGARKGLVDTSLRTATSGYLTRRLVDVVQHLVISDLDCQTNNGILIKKPKNSNFLIGRVLLQKQKSNNFKNFIASKKINNFFPFYYNDIKFNYSKNNKVLLKKNQIISLTLATNLYENQRDFYIRSPLTCQSYKSICQLCYGWDLAKGDLVNIGEAIGIIAAQSIGEPGTQLTMRTFHTGGVGVFSGDSLIKFKAPFDGVIYLPENLPGVLIRNQYGQIFYLLKYTNLNPTRTILELRSQNNKNFYYLIEKQLPTGSILLVRQGQKVKANDILAQASKNIKNTVTLPESLHPIQSKVDGEVFFEKMNLLKKQKISILNSRGTFFIKEKYLKNFASEYVKKNFLNIKPIRKLLPTSNSLSEISSFWVFFTQNQKEFYNTDNFLRIGDLVSYKSFLFQTNFRFLLSSKLKKINTELAFYIPILKIPIYSIKYHKNIYSLVFSNKKKEKALVFWSNYKSSLNQRENFKICWTPTNWFSNKLGFNIFLNLFWNDSNKKNVQFGTLFFTKPSFFFLNNSLLTTLYNSSVKVKQKNLPIFFINNTSNFLENSGLYKLANLKYKKNFYKNKSIFNKKILNNKNLFFSINKLNSNFFKTKPKKIINYNKNWFVVVPLQKLKLSIPKSNYNLSLQKFLSFKENTLPFFSIEYQAISIEYVFSTQINILQEKNRNNSKFKFNFLSDDSQSILNLNIQWNILTKPNLSFWNYLKGSYKQLVLYKIKKLSKNAVKRTKRSKKFTKYSKNLISKPRPLILVKTHLKKTNVKKKRKENDKFLCICIQKVNQKHLSFNIKMQELWTSLFVKEADFKSIKSPFFTKQFSSNNIYNALPIKKFQLKFKFISGWYYSKNFLKIQILLKNKKILTKFSLDYVPDFLQKVKNYHFFKREIFQLSSFILLPSSQFNFDSKNFNIQLFSNNWTLPNQKLITGFKLSSISGEHIRFQKEKNATFWSSLGKKEIITLNLPHPSMYLCLRIGQFIKWGQLICNNFIIPFQGKIIKIKKHQITLRLGMPILVSKSGLIHIKNKDIIFKNQLLLTLKSLKIETRDIVQGIPQIEQLFEARVVSSENTLNNFHYQLEKLFLNTLHLSFQNKNFDIKNTYSLYKLPTITIHSMFDFNFAFKNSLFQFQQNLVNAILQAYIDQGVFISDKHVEIIVKEMTNRVRVLTSGSSGFLPGEIIRLNIVEEFNKKLLKNNQHPIIYDPVVLGITKSVLYSESFLLAASFQEVSRVLSENSINKKTDFLLGLHENIILGQLIPTGVVLFLGF